MNLPFNDTIVIAREKNYRQFEHSMAQIRDKVLLRKISVVIKSLRTARGMTQLDVYNELNIHVARLETCKANPTVSTMGSICAYFGISLTEFYKRVEAEA